MQGSEGESAESQDHVQSWYDRYMNARDRAPDAARHSTWVNTIYGNERRPTTIKLRCLV
jgi:hypothetical protein